MRQLTNFFLLIFQSGQQLLHPGSPIVPIHFSLVEDPRGKVEPPSNSKSVAAPGSTLNQTIGWLHSIGIKLQGCVDYSTPLPIKFFKFPKM